MNQPSNTIRLWHEPIRGVAFDMDGVLFDTEPMYTQVGIMLLEKRGRTFTDALRREMMGRPGPDAIQLMIRHEQLNDHWQDLLAEADEEFLRLAADDLPILPGLDRILEALDEASIPYGVATSSRARIAEELLGRAGLRPRLKYLLTGDRITQGKPHPEIYERAAQCMGILPAQMLVVEDSGNGCAAGVASGACVIAIPGEHSRDHSFRDVAAVLSRLDDPQLLGLLR